MTTLDRTLNFRILTWKGIYQLILTDKEGHAAFFFHSLFFKVMCVCVCVDQRLKSCMLFVSWGSQMSGLLQRCLVPISVYQALGLQNGHYICSDFTWVVEAHSLILPMPAEKMLNPLRCPLALTVSYLSCIFII